MNVSCKGVHAQMSGPTWVSQKPILFCGYHCNAHVTLKFIKMDLVKRF